MKTNYLITVCTTVLSILALAGCDDADKKARQAEREKAKAQEEATRRSLQNPAGNYTPAPLDMSMTPKPAASAAGGEATPKEGASR